MSSQHGSPPGVDRYTTRDGTAAGGVPLTSGRTIAPGIVDQNARYYGAHNDVGIVRDRTSFFRIPRYHAAGVDHVSWTEAGPLRPELHGGRNMSWRRVPGWSNSRFPVVDSPTTGMHTNGPQATDRTVRRYVTVPQMRPARVNRLSGSRYYGQTYSQTTVTQAGQR